MPRTDLTWAALLARWMQFARSALALPQDAEGERWRAAVAPIIGLQAVTFALGDLGTLPPDERALGLDRAEILMDRHEGELRELWRRTLLPPPLAELIADARTALQAAQAWR